MSTPTSANAWQIVRKGAVPAVLELRETPLPKLTPTQVLVKVSHAALNPVDYKLAALIPSFVQKLPRTAATDFAGTIVALGAESLADKYPFLREKNVAVYGTIANVPPLVAYGALQTYTVAEAAQIAPVPLASGATVESASGLGIVGVTALAQSEYVKAGDRVFINGGTTAVGLLAADLVLKKGASLVVATASGSKADFIKKRGVHETVDHRAGDARAELTRRYGDKPFDVALDCIGSKDLHVASAAYLKPGGKWVNIGATVLTPETSVFSADVLGFALWQVRARLPAFLGGHARALVTAVPSRDQITVVNESLAEGTLHPVVDKVFAWKDVPDAYRYLIEGRALGKIVITVGE